MRLILPLAALALSACSAPPRAGHNIVRTERGACLDGHHSPMSVRKLPGTAVTSEKPRNPHEESFVHCGGSTPNDVSSSW